MEQPIKTSELATKAGISASYASEILSGKREKIPRPLAIHIMRTTGWRHSVIADLTDDQIATLEAIEPWQRPTQTAA
jgi:transcriptional regulator with XRE-family HTH domain